MLRFEALRSPPKPLKLYRYCPRPLEGRGHVTLRAAIPIRFACAARRYTRVLREKAAQNASSFRWVCTVTLYLLETSAIIKRLTHNANTFIIMASI